MKIGLDGGPVGGLLEIRDQLLKLLDLAADGGFEGVQFSIRSVQDDPGLRQKVIEKASEKDLFIELGGAGIDKALLNKSADELVEAWKPLFPMAVELGSHVLQTGLGTWPWQGRLIREKGRRLEDQIAGGIEVLRTIGQMAEDHQVSVAIHTAFMTSAEYIEIMERVDSPYVGLCLDTANSFLVLEDPLEFAEQVAPYVRTTHFKDSAIYLQGEGIHWFGGCLLGSGTVDLAQIADALYRANSQINLSVEDHWSHSTRPMISAEYLDSLGEWQGERLARILDHLWRGSQLALPASEVVRESFVERQNENAVYAKQLRDSLISKHEREG